MQLKFGSVIASEPRDQYQSAINRLFHEATPQLLGQMTGHTGDDLRRSDVKIQGVFNIQLDCTMNQRPQ